MKDKKATCKGCGYEYDGRYVMHRQDVKAVIEDGSCTWCYVYSVEKKESLTPVAWAAKRTLEFMGF